jgi:hypothetical protein
VVLSLTDARQILGEQQASIKSGPRRHFVNM